MSSNEGQAIMVEITEVCLCCSVTWQAKHGRGPRICSLCIQSLGSMGDSPQHAMCKEHDNVLDATLMCPQATLTNGPYVPLVAR
jgi:hypothetical protein